ncbi:ribbon-helix-helix protein, CopG family [Rubrobacter taiwanensis]|uniref:Ribbon-helix-helix protein, CopG family n=1 Tax=Rubrobacter taiwanensis TaxID=185139 RepID=A0A4R1BSD2_9ACTN|nr:ribbon-helix-helix protein, CopG family [Rubrobacter taiwanensis]TCJ20704.1 ribbon-helix-helix protein, CopG family [Rubrobacter taiwanensis]
MPQLHLYVPEETAEALRRRARERGSSLSAYLAEIVGREVGGERWPEGFFEEVLGRWEGELERPPQGAYEDRARLG